MMTVAVVVTVVMVMAVVVILLPYQYSQHYFYTNTHHVFFVYCYYFIFKSSIRRRFGKNVKKENLYFTFFPLKKKFKEKVNTLLFSLSQPPPFSPSLLPFSLQFFSTFPFKYLSLLSFCLFLSLYYYYYYY